METELLLVEEVSNNGLISLNSLEDEFLSLESLISINRNIKDLTKHKPLSINQAKLINVAIESLFNKSETTLTIEDFKSDFNSYHNTKAALENIDKEINVKLTNVINWTNQSIDWLVKVLGNYDELYRTISNISIDLNTRVNRLNPNIDSNIKYIENESLAIFFSSSINNISENYTKHIQTCSPVYCEHFVNSLLRNLNTITNQLGQDKGIETFLVELDKVLKNIIENNISFLNKDKELVNENKKEIYYSHQFYFGHHEMKVSLISIDDKLSNIDFDIIKKNVNIENILPLPTLSIKTIKELTNKVQNEMLFGNINNTKTIISNILLLKEYLNNEFLNTIQKEQQDDKEVDIVSLNFVKDITRSIIVVVNLMYKYDALVARKLLEYCEKSINNY